MEERHITAISEILDKWNPLGDRAKIVLDLNRYHTEAIDIIFALKMQGVLKNPERIVMTVLNQAFNLDLEVNDCIDPAKQIIAILKN